ncbi:glycosidase, partial [Chloroflexota bacterium]
VLSLIESNLRPEHLTPCVLKPLPVRYEAFPSLAEMKDTASLDKLTGIMVVSSLHKGMGGKFPKLRYFTTVAKNIIEAEIFGRKWQIFAEERKDIGIKITNSLKGHWARDPLSAHNIFENGNQRLLVKRLREMAKRITTEAEGNANYNSLAESLTNMADSYHLALTMSDGTFIPCSAWSWASYSFKGGTGIPTPLSLIVERDWASAELFTEYFRAIGGREETIEQKITELMGEGREWEDLVPILLGDVQEAEGVLPEQMVSPEYLPAQTLKRFAGNPILEPIKEHPWESKYTFNPGAINIYGKFYIVYRAVGDDGISRFGLAISEDGFNITDRLEEPIFEPKTKSELKGCEDPRLTLIGDRIYLLYTAYDGLVAQIALSSIKVSDFLSHPQRGWQRHGLVFPGLPDKDACLFPETYNRQFVMIHRVEPHLWITFSPHLRSPWPRRKHRILAGTQTGMTWDGLKIGAGGPPLKTKYGWLLIYHGVDHSHIYRLGVMLLDLADPSLILYRSPNPILEPVELYEVGEPGRSWVPNVVFTCGVVPRDSGKEVLDNEDELLIYYGAADTTICVATAKIGNLIPKDS